METETFLQVASQVEQQVNESKSYVNWTSLR